MNKVFLSGNLTRDPEVRYTVNGKPFARMGIAVQRRSYKNSDNNNAQSVDFFNLTAWDKTAEFCGRYLHKGTRVLVEGVLTTSSYEGKDGVKRTSTDIWISNIEFAGNKAADSGNSQQNYKKSDSQNNSDTDFSSNFSGEEVNEDDVPF